MRREEDSVRQDQTENVPFTKTHLGVTVTVPDDVLVTSEARKVCRSGENRQPRLEMKETRENEGKKTHTTQHRSRRYRQRPR
jgi:hypothetical protein